MTIGIKRGRYVAFTRADYSTGCLTDSPLMCALFVVVPVTVSLELSTHVTGLSVGQSEFCLLGGTVRRIGRRTEEVITLKFSDNPPE
jgi:hypothetical protein